MSTVTYQNIQRLPPFLEGLQKRLLQSAFGTFDGEAQTTPGLLDRPLGLPGIQIAGTDPLTAAFLLNLAGIVIGLGLSRLAGLSQRESLAIAVELGIKNGTIALMVTLTLLESSEMSIPAVVYSVLMYGFGCILIAMGRRLVPIHQ